MDLKVLRMAVTSNIQATFDLAEAVGEEVIASQQELEEAFVGSSTGLDSFTRA